MPYLIDGHNLIPKLGLRLTDFDDEAIRLRLIKLGRAAKNWTVVSSDHRVQNEARAAGARVISSDEFARTVIETLREGPPPSSRDKSMSERELEEWLRLFDKKDR